MVRFVSRLLLIGLLGCVGCTADVDASGEALTGPTSFLDACGGTVGTLGGTFECEPDRCTFDHSSTLTGELRHCATGGCRRSVVGTSAWQSTAQTSGARATWTFRSEAPTTTGESPRAELVVCATNATGAESCTRMTELARCGTGGCTHSRVLIDGQSATTRAVAAWVARHFETDVAQSAMSLQVEASSMCVPVASSSGETDDDILCDNLDLISDLHCTVAYDEEACEQWLNAYFCNCGSGVPLDGHEC